jgi:hypothetical protein
MCPIVASPSTVYQCPIEAKLHTHTPSWSRCLNLHARTPSLTDGRGTGAESRELAAGYGWELGSGSGLGKDGDVMEGQGAAEDATFRDSDRGRG